VQSLVVCTRGDAAALTSTIKNAIWSVDRDQPIVRVATLDSLVATSEAERHFVLILFESFGPVALVLAATGIYGVLSGGVTERMREIGVRVAVGATRGDILALVVRQGMTLTALGVVIGSSGGVVTSQALTTLLFKRLTPRSRHVSRRNRIAGRRVGDRLRPASLARGADRSGEHVTS
jgi:putative ABC transport system permease protein